MNNFSNSKNIKLQCKPFESWIKDIVIYSGSGGSNNIIILGKSKNVPIVVKCIPRKKKKTL